MMDSPRPSAPLQRLREAVERANYVIDTAIYHETRDLFTAWASNPQNLRNLRQLAPGYGKPEFLLCVHSDGSTVYSTEQIFEDFEETTRGYPSFGLWFQEAKTNERPTLLIARWLCHLVGFRHRSVHLFIDHPTQDDYTLVQIRGLSKFESPGCFDLPAAGHVVGLESTMNTSFKELKEELNLDQDDVDALEILGSYNYEGGLSDLSLCNVEHRVVFRSRLKADKLSKIRFADREAAAISVFALPELQALIDADPERIASGLAASFPIYLRYKNP
jgi:isopentenyldiphosphate isomerase